MSTGWICPAGKAPRGRWSAKPPDLRGDLAKAREAPPGAPGRRTSRPILLQIANLKAEDGLDDVDIIRSGIEGRDLIFQINLARMRGSRRGFRRPAVPTGSRAQAADVLKFHQAKETLIMFNPKTKNRCLSCSWSWPVAVAAVAALQIGGPADEAQTEDAKAYKAAYNLVLQEKWPEAGAALDAFLAKLPEKRIGPTTPGSGAATCWKSRASGKRRSAAIRNS